MLWKHSAPVTSKSGMWGSTSFDRKPVRRQTFVRQIQCKLLTEWQGRRNIVSANWMPVKCPLAKCQSINCFSTKRGGTKRSTFYEVNFISNPNFKKWRRNKWSKWQLANAIFNTCIDFYCLFVGATTLSIMTFSIMTLSITTETDH